MGTSPFGDQRIEDFKPAKIYSKDIQNQEDMLMPDHIYKTIELTGSSTSSIEEAVDKAIAKVSKTIHNLRWFKVDDIRGVIEGNAVSHWQVTMKVGFTIDE